MTKYQEFLDKINIIPEDLFNEIVDSLPDFDIEDTNLDNLYDFGSSDEIAAEIISTILNNWSYVTCEDINFEKRIFDLCDVESKEDLEEIKKHFSKWTISNYDECLEDIEKMEEENKYSEKRDELLDYIRNNTTIEELEEFVKTKTL